MLERVLQEFLSFLFFHRSCSSAANNFVREGPANDVVSHCCFPNSRKLMQSTSKNLSKFVSGGHDLLGLILAALLCSYFLVVDCS